jgi:hypothetical protein
MTARIERPLFLGSDADDAAIVEGRTKDKENNEARVTKLLN